MAKFLVLEHARKNIMAKECTAFYREDGATSSWGRGSVTLAHWLKEWRGVALKWNASNRYDVGIDEGIESRSPVSGQNVVESLSEYSTFSNLYLCWQEF